MQRPGFACHSFSPYNLADIGSATVIDILFAALFLALSNKLKNAF
jgi:hypothetical protein